MSKKNAKPSAAASKPPVPRDAYDAGYAVGRAYRDGIEEGTDKAARCLVCIAGKVLLVVGVFLTVRSLIDWMYDEVQAPTAQ